MDVIVDHSIKSQTDARVSFAVTGRLHHGGWGYGVLHPKRRRSGRGFSSVFHCGRRSGKSGISDRVERKLNFGYTAAEGTAYILFPLPHSPQSPLRQDGGIVGLRSDRRPLVKQHRPPQLHRRRGDGRGRARQGTFYVRPNTPAARLFRPPRSFFCAFARATGGPPRMERYVFPRQSKDFALPYPRKEVPPPEKPMARPPSRSRARYSSRISAAAPSPSPSARL